MRRVLASLLVVLAACGKTTPPEPAAAASAAPSAGNEPLVLAPRDQIKWIQAPAGTADVASLVKTTLASAHADGRTMVVYVGATWCEPCQRFHHAVDHGDLDAAFPKLTVLGFDVDTDREGLATAGYVSRLIPLFALPGADGRASGKQIEGGVKGEGAANEIVPRLRSLVASGS